jgi:hypothetical protein
MSEANKVEFTGTIEKLQSVTTKTGTSMTRWLIKVGQDRFKCVCFGNLADAVLHDRISLTGSGGINSWQDQDEHWHNDFQVTAWAVEIDGKIISYQKADIRSRQKSFPDQAPPSDDRDPSQFDYSGGPF